MHWHDADGAREEMVDARGPRCSQLRPDTACEYAHAVRQDIRTWKYVIKKDWKESKTVFMTAPRQGPRDWRRCFANQINENQEKPGTLALSHGKVGFAFGAALVVQIKIKMMCLFGPFQ